VEACMFLCTDLLFVVLCGANLNASGPITRSRAVDRRCASHHVMKNAPLSTSLITCIIQDN
ncbi:hypothetical protein, partial [Stenotrophomonas maltophilia]|uniref:hypothetical protein n=1 Tax=Stenotrophomonas maltophilia TaxID=40324 RepID=UPI001954906D